MITQSQLKEFLDYNPDTGVFTWRPRALDQFKSTRSYTHFNKNRVAVALKPNKTGYVATCITIDGVKRSYAAHRLAWLYVYGVWPDVIDHINHNPSDNRIKNLRSVDLLANGRNQKLHKHNTSGVNGVSWDKSKSCWVAQIIVEGGKINLGRRKSMSDAAELRELANIKHGFHINHGAPTP